MPETPDPATPNPATPIRLRNSLTRRVEELAPIDPSNVRMYVCGPTVYDRAHLGNARSAVVFDVLFRLLRHVYGADHVTYVRNITDIDDKIIARAAETGRPVQAITAETTRWYHEDMDALGCLRPTHEPRATDYLPQMIAMIAALIEGGHAYEAQGHVLFSVASYEAYGRLSGRSVEDMIAGARVEVAPYKRDAMDFVLWKPSGDGMPGWESPWGLGRPGWHIECSAMARDLLGGEFDIHGGGLDLQFPHHENEIAQSACVGDSLARVWVHNEMLMVDGKKMSKSLGNFFTVRDLLDRGVPGEVIRLVLLGSHYSKPMDWTERKVDEAKIDLDHWRSAIQGVDPETMDEGLLSSLRDDLNFRRASIRLGELDVSDQWGSLLGSAGLLGLLLPGMGSWWELRKSKHSQGALHRLVEFRRKARENGSYETADEIRNQLQRIGIELRDVPGDKVRPQLDVEAAVSWARSLDPKEDAHIFDVFYDRNKKLIDIHSLVDFYQEDQARRILDLYR